MVQKFREITVLIKNDEWHDVMHSFLSPWCKVILLTLNPASGFCLSMSLIERLDEHQIAI